MERNHMYTKCYLPYFQGLLTSDELVTTWTPMTYKELDNTVESWQNWDESTLFNLLWVTARHIPNEWAISNNVRNGIWTRKSGSEVNDLYSLPKLYCIRLVPNSQGKRNSWILRFGGFFLFGFGVGSIGAIPCRVQDDPWWYFGNHT